MRWLRRRGKRDGERKREKERDRRGDEAQGEGIFNFLALQIVFLRFDAMFLVLKREK